MYQTNFRVVDALIFDLQLQPFKNHFSLVQYAQFSHNGSQLVHHIHVHVVTGPHSVSPAYRWLHTHAHKTGKNNYLTIIIVTYYTC